MSKTKSLVNTFALAAMLSTIVLGIAGSVPVSAQYNGSSSSSSATANVTTSVSGNTLTVSFTNVSAGNTINLNNLTVPGLNSLQITFSANVTSGSITLTPVTSSELTPGLPNTFITGYRATYSGVDQSQVSNMTLGLTVSDALVSSYSSVMAYYSASTWMSTTLTNSGTDASGNVVYTLSAPAFSQIALSGSQTQSGDLIRTGADSINMMIISGLAVAVMGYFLYQSVNTSRRSHK